MDFQTQQLHIEKFLSSASENVGLPLYSTILTRRFRYGRLFKTIPGDALPPWPYRLHRDFVFHLCPRLPGLSFQHLAQNAERHLVGELRDFIRWFQKDKSLSSITDLKFKALLCLMFSFSLCIGEVRHLKCLDIEHSRGKIL